MHKIIKALFNKFGNIIGISLIVLLVVGLLVLVPVLFIWGINLIGIPVAYTFKTWSGALIIMTILRGGSSKK